MTNLTKERIERTELSLFKLLEERHIENPLTRSFIQKTFLDLQTKRLLLAKEERNRTAYLFYSTYLNKYDFLHVIGDRGLLFGFYLNEIKITKSQLSKMCKKYDIENKDEFESINEIPLNLLKGYFEYLDLYIKESQGDESAVYTEEDAFEDFESSFYLEDFKKELDEFYEGYDDAINDEDYQDMLESQNEDNE